MLKKLLFCFLFLSGMGMARSPDLLTFSTGVYSSRHKALFNVEYRGSLKEECAMSLRPQIGLLISEFHCYYVYAGIGYDFIIKNRFALTPNFSSGLYFHTRSGRKLGYPIEFRSSIDVSYIFDNLARVGFQIFHISNGSMGRKNPGLNAIAFFLGLPIQCF